MEPIKSFSKNIDDIKLYIEIFASEKMSETFLEEFENNAFKNKADNVFILLHGNGEDGRLFSKNIDAFCDGCYVITVDSRGHGNSTHGEQKLTIDLMAEDLSKLCDELNIGKFKLLGFSDGGNIALTYAVRHPERLSGLVVVGANIDPAGIKFFYRSDMIIKYLFANMFYKNNKVKKIRFELLDLMVNYPHIAPRLLKNIVCPTLVVDAQYDVIKCSHTDLIAKYIPNSTQVRIKKAHHNVFADAPDRVNKLVHDFITKGDKIEWYFQPAGNSFK